MIHCPTYIYKCSKKCVALPNNCLRKSNAFITWLSMRLLQHTLLLVALTCSLSTSSAIADAMRDGSRALDSSSKRDSSSPDSFQLSKEKSTPPHQQSDSAGDATTDEPNLTEKAAKSTSPRPVVEVPTVNNVDIFGCHWPDDFLGRYEYCARQAGADLSEETAATDRLNYGLLSRHILDAIYADCRADDLSSCVKKIPDAQLDAFIDVWQTAVHNYTAFQTCLQTNTEAMNRLCGTTSNVSRVVSGAAGLQLNLLNVLVRVDQDRRLDGVNVTQACLRKTAEAVHITAAMYTRSQHYMDNSVLCWDSARDAKSCSAACATFAAELTCMQSYCAGALQPTTLQNMGIWQWYFLDPPKARQSCGVDDSKCKVDDNGVPIQPTPETLGSLFTVKHLQERFHEVQQQLEHQFNLPFYIISIIFGSVLLLIIGVFCVACCWRYGLLCSRRKTTRYSRILDAKLNDTTDGTGLLTHSIDVDDIE